MTQHLDRCHLFHLKIKKYLTLNYLMSSGRVPFIVVEQTTFSSEAFRASRPLLPSSGAKEKQGRAHRWDIPIGQESVTCLNFVKISAEAEIRQRQRPYVINRQLILSRCCQSRLCCTNLPMFDLRFLLFMLTYDLFINNVYSVYSILALLRHS